MALMHSIGNPYFFSAFMLAVVFLLVLDLGVFQRKAHAVKAREALVWSLVWVALSVAFGMWIYSYYGSKSGLEFFTGYLIEKALSVDNVFVFVLIFSYFKVPAHLHHRVLFWGILGALVMRAAFILAGAVLISKFHWVIYIFGAFLVYTGLKILQKGNAEVEPEHNPLVRLFQRFVPMTSDHGTDGFWVRREGKILATPLALALVTVEATDLVFAVDSIPAIFGITQDPFIVYTSNVCAILGLRSMYFLLAAVINRFVYLGKGLGIVLMFIGAKMLLGKYYPLRIEASLIVVAGILVGSVLISLLWPPKSGNSSNSKPPLVTSNRQRLYKNGD
jgi:tellurite resistance protein TerC